MTKAFSILMESGWTLYPFVFTQFPSRQMILFGSKLLGPFVFTQFPSRQMISFGSKLLYPTGIAVSASLAQ